MKNLICLSIGLVIGVLLGYYSASKLSQKETETKVIEQVTDRYLKIVGNPTNQEEQCKFDYIIYADTTQCP
jgi:hypothetical protein